MKDKRESKRQNKCLLVVGRAAHIWSIAARQSICDDVHENMGKFMMFSNLYVLLIGVGRLSHINAAVAHIWPCWYDSTACETQTMTKMQTFHFLF